MLGARQCCGLVALSGYYRERDGQQQKQRLASSTSILRYGAWRDEREDGGREQRKEPAWKPKLEASKGRRNITTKPGPVAEPRKKPGCGRRILRGRPMQRRASRQCMRICQIFPPPSTVVEHMPCNVRQCKHEGAVSGLGVSMSKHE